MAEEITKENNPGRWEAFMKQWKLEHEPGWLVVGQGTYEVIRKADNVVIFRRKNAEEFYESRSF